MSKWQSCIAIGSVLTIEWQHVSKGLANLSQPRKTALRFDFFRKQREPQRLTPCFAGITRMSSGVERFQCSANLGLVAYHCQIMNRASHR